MMRKRIGFLFMRKVNGVEKRYHHTGDLYYMNVSDDLMYVERID